MILVVIKHAAKLPTDNGHSFGSVFLFCIEDAIRTTEILSDSGGRGMITARLEEGTSIKTCNQCKYETSSVTDMLTHLEIHNQEEINTLKSQKMVYRRVLKE